MPLAAPAPARRNGSQSLDLKWSLTMRVGAIAVVCFLVAAALALYGTYRELRQANDAVADIVAQQLQMQLLRIDSSIDLPARFPDWGPVIERVQSAGQCIEYVKADGSDGRSSCVGVDGSDEAAPAWFSWLASRLLTEHTDSVRPLSYRGKDSGKVVVTTKTSVVIAAIWKKVSGLLGLTALLVVAICLLQFVAISRALRPTKDILAALDRLARGDLSHRLPRFRLNELQRIADVFNALAASLDRTTRERTALAARLVDKQEQERSHLARELHDELAQMLSVLSAAAASIKATAETKCPELVPEAKKLSQTAMALMKSLRATLHTLRAPEIDDFGLAASLAALARDQERRTGGKLKVSLELDHDLNGLSPTAASHVYRIVQEGLTNIGKHANAKRARVALDFRPQPLEKTAPERRWLALTIEDDGCGAPANGTAVEGGGLGLIGMRERAMALGGQLDVIHRDRGFKLEALIPFAAPVETSP